MPITELSTSTEGNLNQGNFEKVPRNYDSVYFSSNSQITKTSGLVDLQVNGFAGVDFNTPGITGETLKKSLQTMLASGVITCLPTLITSSEEHLKSCFRDLEN